MSKESLRKGRFVGAFMGSLLFCVGLVQADPIGTERPVSGECRGNGCVVGSDRHSEVQLPCLQQTLSALPASTEFDARANRLVQTTRRSAQILGGHIEGCRNLRPIELRCRVLGARRNPACLRAAATALLPSQDPARDQAALEQNCQTLDVSCN